MPPIPKAPPSMHDPKLMSRTHAASPEDEIVITGVAGKFPNSKNIEEFAHHLYNKVNLKQYANSEKNVPNGQLICRLIWLTMKKLDGVILMWKFLREWAKLRA